MKFVTRFAPSPTGPLHLGHAYSALLAHDMAVAKGGDFLLRIDDLDQSRSRDHWEEQIYDDLHWLGLSWPEPCRKQSECQRQYDRALDILWKKGLLFECTCSRRDIRDAQSAPQEGQLQYGPDGLIYPGTCRHSNRPDNPLFDPRPTNATLRLDMAKAIEYSFQNTKLFLPPRAGEKTRYGYFGELGPSSNRQTHTYEFTAEMMLEGVGDVVVCRKNMGAAYHLAVVVDDQEQKVSHVVRGADLLEATMIHLLIGHLLDDEVLHYWYEPTYHHHKLIRDDNGKRLAKRDDARAIAKYRAEGVTPEGIRKMVGLD